MKKMEIRIVDTKLYKKYCVLCFPYIVAIIIS